VGGDGQGHDTGSTGAGEIIVPDCMKSIAAWPWTVTTCTSVPVKQYLVALDAKTGTEVWRHD
jgi:outer membrane protein assembly factor BamB